MIINPKIINEFEIKFIIGPTPLLINIDISAVKFLIIFPVLLSLKKLKSCSKYFLNIFLDN